jgi:hypothetical protein
VYCDDFPDRIPGVNPGHKLEKFGDIATSIDTFGLRPHTISNAKCGDDSVRILQKGTLTHTSDDLLRCNQVRLGF